MHKLSRVWGEWVVKQRVVILALTLLLMVFAPLSFNRLYHDNSNENFFLENDQHLEAYNRLVERFGDPEYLQIGIAARPRDQDVFAPETIKMIDELTTFLEAHRHVTQVRSLSKYQYTHDDGGMLATDDLFEDVSAIFDEPELLDQAREIIAGEQLAMETLISPDFGHTRIVARSVYMPGENSHKVELTHELLAFIEKNGYLAQGYNLQLSGMPIIGERFETLTQRDMAWINPVMGIIMVCILFVVFRSFFATAIPLVVILSTMLFVTSLQGWLKWPFTAVNSALIPTVIILCVGTCVHVLVEFFQFRFSGRSPQHSAVETVNDLFYAVLFTCLTTSAGFIALAVTELRPVREFAVLAAIAPMIIFLISMTALPALLSYIPWLPRNKKEVLNNNATLDAESALTQDGQNHSPALWLAHKLPKFTFIHRKKIGVIGLLITLVSLYGVTLLRVDANIENYFKKDSWVNQALLYFNENFKGISNLEVIVDTGEEGGVKNPAILKRVDALQQYLSSFDETGKPTSVVDFYKQINQSLNEDNPDFFILPTTREMAAQFLLLYENTGPDEDLSDLKDFNEQYLRVRVPIINMDETAITRTINAINQGIADKFSDLKLEITGNLVMNNAQNHYVNNGMFISFGVAILTIGASFILLFRSFKYGLIALLPSIVPVLLTGGIVSMAGVALDLGTMIVGAMTIGIAVDDSIHLMSRYLLMRRRGKTVYGAVQYAMNSSGRAVILTSIILVSGFSVMLLGSFVSYIYVGLFSAMIMTLALVGDLTFMPALLYIFDGDHEQVTGEIDKANTQPLAASGVDLKMI